MVDEIVQDVVDEGSSSVPRMHGEDIEDFLARSTRNHESRDNPLALAPVYSQPLSLDLPVAFLALGIADTAGSLPALRNSSEEFKAIYIASHIFDQPRCLADIARLTVVSERRVYSIYRETHSDRYELVLEE